MKLYLDTADTTAIRRACETGLVDGVTTNPSLIAATGRPYREVVNEIITLLSGPISVEAIGVTAEDLVEESVSIARLAPNIVVKIPMTTEGLKAVSMLNAKQIRTNVTMVFSGAQAFLAMKAGASYVSIVLSRLDACGSESEILVDDTMTIKRNYGFASEIIAGSLKTQNHILACLRAGVDIATLPPALFFQLFEHPLTSMGIAQFEKDWAIVAK